MIPARSTTSDSCCLRGSPPHPTCCCPAAWQASQLQRVRPLPPQPLLLSEAKAAAHTGLGCLPAHTVFQHSTHAGAYTYLLMQHTHVKCNMWTSVVQRRQRAGHRHGSTRCRGEQLSVAAVVREQEGFKEGLMQCHALPLHAITLSHDSSTTSPALHVQATPWSQ